MLIDNKMVFFDDIAVADGDTKTITIDLYGLDIPIYPNSNLDKNHGRGEGTPVLVHVVLDPDVSGPLGGTDGSVSLLMEDATPATVEVIKIPLLSSSWEPGHVGRHYVFAIPYYAEGRYATLTVDLSAVTGMGSFPKLSAFMFVQ